MLSTTEVWNQFSDVLRNFILRRVNDPQDADDLLQEVFIKIHTRLDTLDDTESLTGWIYRITRNTIIDYYRRRRPAEPLPESLSVYPEPVEADPEALIASGLRSMVENLPDKYRQALLLTEFNGVRQVELADKLGLSVSGAKSRVQRGRELLRQALYDCCHFEFDLRGKMIDYQPRPDCCEQCEA
jgi:RNA polymerase sigma-70 factor (ECF subfamily)